MKRFSYTFLTTFFAICMNFPESFGQYFFEDFESYTPGAEIVDVSPQWIITEQVFGGTSPIVGLYTPSMTRVLIINHSEESSLLLGDKTSGKYAFGWKMYIQNDAFFGDIGEPKIEFWLEGEPNVQSSAGFFFSQGGEGYYYYGNGFGENFNFPYNEWFNFIGLIDLDKDSLTVLIDDEKIGTWQFSLLGLDPGTGPKQLSEINILNFGTGIGVVLLDDIGFYEGIEGFSQIYGRVANDLNTNCQANASEPGLPSFQINLANSIFNGIRITNSLGNYQFVLPQNDYNVTVTPPNPYWEMCSFPGSTSLTTDEKVLNFVAHPVIDCPSMTVDLTAPLLRRCFQSNLFVQYCNEGTVPANPVIIKIALDSFMNFIGSTHPVAMQDGDTLYFEMGEVGVGVCGEFIIQFEIDCSAPLGGEHCYSAQIFPDTPCIVGLRELSFVEECRENIGSFDPNDKMGFPAGIGASHWIEPGTELKYQIRFQNTGTDTAFNIVIKDTLSEHFQISTIRPGAASHPYQMFIDEGRVLRVVFPDIMLPDSNVNEPLSHGFFNYFILPKSELPDGTKVENQAGIFFDFNEPVWTNTTFHTIDIENSTDNPVDGITFSVFPNPTENGFTVITPADIDAGICNVYDPGGKLVKSFIFENNAFFVESGDRSLPAGLYFIRVTGKNGYSGVQKIVVH